MVAVDRRLTEAWSVPDLLPEIKIVTGMYVCSMRVSLKICRQDYQGAGLCYAVKFRGEERLKKKEESRIKQKK